MPAYRPGVCFIRQRYDKYQIWGVPFESAHRGTTTFRADSTGIVVTGDAAVSGNATALKGVFSDSLRTPRIEATNGIIARLGPASSATTGGAIRIVDGVTFPLTTPGVQKAIEEVGAIGKGTVWIMADTLLITTAIRLHSGLWIRGNGEGVTIIKRAPGALASGDSAYTGCTFIVTPYGDNINHPTGLPTAQHDITISDMTIDGNASAFPSVNPSTPRHMALYAFWTDGLRMFNVDARNFLQNGVYLDACRNSSITGCRFTGNGAYSSLSSKNSIDISNTQSSAIGDGYATNFTIGDIVSVDPGDHHIDIANCNMVSISNVVTKGGFVVVEVQGDTTRTTAMHGISVSNVVANGNQYELFANNISTGVSLSDVSIMGCSMVGHTSLQNTPAVVVSNPTTSSPVHRFTLANSSFTNLNSRDADAIVMLDIRGASASQSTDINVDGCTFIGGAPSSTRTDCHGAEVRTNVSGLRIANCTFRTVPGVGVYIHPYPDQTISDVVVEGCLADVTNSYPYQFVENASTNGVLKNLLCTNSTAKDGCRQTGQVAFTVGALSAAGGGSVSNVTVSNCLAYKTSGSEPSQGLRTEQGAGGTTDKVFASGNDFSQIFLPYVRSGSPTNCYTNTESGNLVIPDSLRVGKGAAFQDSVFIRNRLAVDDSARFNLGFYAGGNFMTKMTLSGTLTFPIASVAAAATFDTTLTFTGIDVASAWVPTLAPISADLPVGISIGSCRVSADNAVKVRFSNATASPIWIPSQTWRIGAQK